MAYIGNQGSVAGFVNQPSKQDLTGASGGTLTLTHAVSKPEDISLFINNVRQEPTESYTAVGTTVTLQGYTVAATDDIYVLYNGLAQLTSTVADGSVSSAKIADNAVTSAKINDVTAKQATENTPMFKVYRSANQSISTTTWTKVTFDSEFTGGDPLNEFDTTDSRYQPSVAGWYHIIFNPSFQGNGGSVRYGAIMKNTSYMIYAETVGSVPIRTTVSGLIYLNGTSDYVEFQMYTQGTSSLAIRGGSNETQAQGFLVRAD